ncbi:helix-turn-helix transcriptional regulator [Alkalihalobacillus pseudalcaliphilus]|uniref:helix-turn-helix transcriptional regulator n=1 Tax=Alkalihalobacillus pseudalcaliphilus TaxID=79884 RepID=UPI00069EB77E|nr:AraC family transcriptional regulator [Alkalihalobacillus pseudalcaliphilus]
MFLADYCDYSCYERDQQRIYRPNGLGMFLFLRFYTPMRITLNDQIEFSQPNACLLYTPECPQDYRAIGSFQNSYIHFQETTNILNQYDLPTNQIIYPQDLKSIDNLLRQIQFEFLSTSKLKEEMIDALLRQLFTECSRQLDPPHDDKELVDLYPAFRKLRLSLLTQCERNWTTLELCRYVHLEKSQLYAYYKRFFHISPKTDLLNARINKAKQMLVNQAITIAHIAENCGFSSASHFSRTFKSHTGLSPKDYRENKIK